MKGEKFDKNKLIAGGVTALLIVFFVGGFLLGLDRISSMEGTYPEPVNAVGLVEAPPETPAEVIELINSLLEVATKCDPSLKYEDSFSFVNSDERPFVSDGSAEFNSTLMLAKDNIISHISSVEETEGFVSFVNYGGDISQLLRVPDLEEDDIKSVKHNMIYFTCLSCGESIEANEENTVPPSSCEKCGSQRAYFEKYRDVYTVEIVLRCEAPFADDSVLNRNFAPRTTEQINALTADVLLGSAVLNINNEEDIVYNTLKINVEFNRLTNEIISLSYIKEMTVNADIVFEGEYAQFETKHVSFGLNETCRYSFTWPSLTLSENKLVIEPGDTDNLLATRIYDEELVTDEDAKEKLVVKWTSSDESIAKVDDRGYISTSKEAHEDYVIITASFEYLGVVYEDSCMVFVRVPVESMKMKTKKVDLNVGETAQLEVSISPKKATDKNVRWRSENEAIATVDENGVVTAVSSGTVVIIAISDDGDFKSTCEVSVK